MRSKLIPVAIAALLATGPVVGVSAGPAKAQANRAERLTGAAGAELGARRVTRDLHRVFAAARKDLVKHCASQPLTSPANLGDRPYFIRAIGTRGYAVGDFQLGRVAGAETLGMGFPVRGANGVINGLVFSSMSVSWLDRHVGGKRPRGALDVLVVDEHGTVLARAGKRQTRPGRNLAAKSLVRAMLANDEGIGEFRLAGRPVISAFETVLPTGGAVHVAVSVRR